MTQFVGVFALVVLLLTLACAVPLTAEEPDFYQSDRGVRPGGQFNIKGRTLGGSQFWADQLFFHGWRIQRNVVTGHYRLLDEDDYRYAWGTYAACRGKLDTIRRERQLPVMKGKAVVVLHGLVRTRRSMNGLCRYLEEHGGYKTFNVTYPTTRGDVGTHAAQLARIMENLQGIEEINFVTHSLGGLVIRHYLADMTDEKNGRKPDPRIRRIVMLGPPNQATQLAQNYGKNNPIWEFVSGSSGKQLSGDWDELEKRLATPECEFGIIAGGKGRNPLIEGESDLVVTVKETRLAGARDFAVLPLFHTFLMTDATAQRYTLRFLEEGCFISERKRQPISADNESEK